MIDFLIKNWLLVALGVIFVAMHRRGHGCGMHDRDGDRRVRHGNTRARHDQGAAP